MSSQIHEFDIVVAELTNGKIVLPEPYLWSALIEKLPDSWKDYKNTLKHKINDMTMEQIIMNIYIKDKN